MINCFLETQYISRTYVQTYKAHTLFMFIKKAHTETKFTWRLHIFKNIDMIKMIISGGEKKTRRTLSSSYSISFGPISITLNIHRVQIGFSTQ